MTDSRRYPRKNIDGEVKVHINGGIYLGGLRDISEGGLSVSTSTPYQVGYEMFLSVELSGEAESVNVLAEVIWVHPLEATFHPTGMGLRFLALEEDDYYKLEKVLEQN